MKITKTELQKIIKEELIKEAIDLKSFEGLATDDQDIRNDFTEAQKLSRILEKTRLGYLSDTEVREFFQVIQAEIKELQKRSDIAEKVKKNKFSDVNNIKNLEILILGLSGLGQSIIRRQRLDREFPPYDPSRED